MQNDIGKFVIVRTHSAGVHTGTLVSYAGQEVRLQGARRIWRWRGANTLHELALHGADMPHTRISEPLDHATLLQAIEILPCTEDAAQNLQRSRWS